MVSVITVGPSINEFSQNKNQLTNRENFSKSMILGFSEHMRLVDDTEEDISGKPFVYVWETQFERKINDGVKIHTLRRDENHRWMKGRVIQFALAVRTRDQRTFKTGRCESVQEVEIINEAGARLVLVDERQLTPEEFRQFWVNDGFDHEEQFWQWFNASCKMKLVSWTDHQY
jgi:hypothetical protein